MTVAGLGQSRSAPSLFASAAGSNLRSFSTSRGKIAPPTKRPDSAGEWAKKKAEFGNIDLIGGNGRWRQRLAEEVFEKVRAENEAERQRIALLEEKRAKRAAMKAELKRKYQEEEDQKWREEQERKRIEKEAIEAEKREAEMKEYMRKKAEMEENAKRQPKPCTTCDATGVCSVCNGLGYVYSVFLVSEVNGDAQQEYGRKMVGCTACGGCRQGIRGELVKGSGKCATCDGRGLVWPDIAYEERTNYRRKGNTGGRLSHSATNLVLPTTSY